MILNHNKSLIQKTLGKQGSSQCGVYAVAYGFTILEGKCRCSGSPASHQSVANKYNGGTYAVCYWSRMGVTSRSGSSVKDRYAKIITELKKGKPVVVAVQGSSANHYVLVIGVRDGKNSSNVKESDFYIIDPADCKFGYFGSTWAHGFNKSSYGLQYCTFNKGSVGSGGDVGGSAVATTDHPQTWYENKYGNEARVYFWMRSLGYSHKGTCAIMGNIAQESNFNTSVTSRDGYGSKGMCQWTGGRLTNLKNFAKSNNMEWTSVECQCKFLHKELGSYKKLQAALISGSDTLYNLTYDFCFTFERPAKAYANMTNRSNKAKTYLDRYKNAYGGGAPGEEGFYGEEGAEGYSVNMQKRSEQLYSSNNYGWLYEQEKEETEEQKRDREANERFKNAISNIKLKNFTDANIEDIRGQSMKGHEHVKKIRTAREALSISHAMVESPFVEVDFAGTVIGTYKNSVDDFPDHISRLEVEKVNGEINKYAFELTHQIRAGEDPNLIDKIIAKVRYTFIRIRYGDFNSNVIYGDERAIITNVSMNRNYATSKISYTILATSAGEFITSHKLNFPARTEKPSTIINELFYKNSQTSNLLLDSFPGMRNASLVSSNNLIPTNDARLNIDAKTNVNTIEYINYLVGCMSSVANDVNDVIRSSSYYVSYENDFMNQLGGAFMKITEVVKGISGANNIFEVTVGFPDNNYVMGFNVDNDIAWSILYENMATPDEYIYTINDKGQKVKQYSPNIMSSTSPMNEIQKNWWTQMINYPISATLTLKGLMKPTMLMSFIRVNVVFYGQHHITSGTYAITGQKDVLSGEGFRTILALTRVGE